MKHKRIAVAVTSVLFAAVVFLSGWVICTVRMVNVEYSYCTLKTKDEILVEKAVLDKLVGKSVFSVKEEDVSAELASNPYIKVCSVKVKLPSSVVVSIEERREAFCVEKEGKFYPMTDECLVLDETEENAARSDGLPNVVITGDVGAPEVNTVHKGDELFSIAVKILLSFDDPRNELEKIVVDKYYLDDSSSPENEWNRIYVYTAEGAVFEISRALEFSDEKVALLREVYDKLDGEDRVNRTVEIFTFGDGVSYE